MELLGHAYQLDLEQADVDGVITIVDKGMNAAVSFEVRLALIRALYNALDFAETTLLLLSVLFQLQG